jgi:hypothetical protein
MSQITDHPFEPPSLAQWWGLCKHSRCHLTESVHAETTAAVRVGLTYRCPYCVNLDIKWCVHGRIGALGMDGKPLDAEPEQEEP